MFIPFGAYLFGDKFVHTDMALTTNQQIHQLIKDKKNILITMHKDPTGDAIGSAIALSLFLKKMDKVVDIICDQFTLPKQFKFLKDADKIKNTPSHLQKFIITVDTKDIGVEELSYDLKNEKLHIYLTPKKGTFGRDAVRTAQTDYKYDMMFVLDTEDLGSLGDFYNTNTELFYKTPIVNIDHHASNEHFGQINITDITTVSTAEVLYELMKKLGEEYIDEDVATALLTGLIAKTRSFKSNNIKPHTLATAGKLISMGADREKIVNNLYRTRSISALKLWGNTLAHIQVDKSIGLVWSTITRDDFVRSGAAEADLKDVIDELIGNSPETNVTLLLHEHADSPQTIHGLLRVHTNNADAKRLLANYNPNGSKQAVSFKIINKTLKQAEEEITTHLQKQLKVA
jgi:bifunctional oligoribonuclease and PAP phosphatase NrnA